MNMRCYGLPLILLVTLLLSLGCESQEGPVDEDFHTSGSREADQRAEQRIARERQMGGKSATEEQTLFVRLGGEAGIAAITSDFVDRALADPRVNWRRQGIESGGVLGIGGESVAWRGSAGEIERMKTHIAQFFMLATGGPTQYQGRELKDVHAGMKITNAQFDAAIGDLKASLDVLKVPTQEQKELLAIAESTRPQIVEER